jgi:ketose-bisphosphate aldolase
MTLISLKAILKPARKEKYAVGSFNILDIQMIRGVIEAAEEEHSPVILAFGDIHSKIINFDIIFPLMVKMAKKAKVPVSVILDHGMSFKSIMSALKYGATGVMFDGSSLPYDQNVNKTREIVKIAHSLGVSVEAEIGHVAVDKNKGKEIYTEPRDALNFIKDTKVDALAISIGTAHGICIEKPQLDFDRLAKINEICDIPLVLHGGSGVSDEDFRKCIENGISKINFFSRISNAIAESLKAKLNSMGNEPYYQDIVPLVRDSCKAKVKEKIRIFGSNNRIL